MGYSKASGQWADTLDLQFLAAAGIISATGSSPVIEVGDRGNLRVTAAFTAVTGSSPTLDIKVMTCDTAGGTFKEVIANEPSAAAFAQFTGATTQRKRFGGMDRFVRLDYTIGGTAGPSFTGSILGEAC